MPRVSLFWVGLAFILAFAFGRHTAPPRVETKTVTVEKTAKAQEKKNVQIVTRIIQKATGETVTEITEKDLSTRETVDTAQSLNTQKIETPRKDWTVGALVLFDWGFQKEYGGFVTHHFIGPVSLGVVGTQRGAGLIASVNF